MKLEGRINASLTQTQRPYYFTDDYLSTDEKLTPFTFANGPENDYAPHIIHGELTLLRGL
jgi:hypothetical protein